MADETAMGEVADAVEAVDYGHHELQCEEREAPEGKAVVGVKQEGEDDGKTHKCFSQTDIGVDVHLLVGDDRGVVGGLQYAEKTAEDGCLIDPVGGDQAGGGDGKVGVDEPKADCFSGDKDNESEENMDIDGHVEYLAVVALVAFAKLVGEVALGGDGHGAVDYGHKGYYASDHVHDTKVLNAKGFKDFAGGVQADHHRHECADVEVDGVAGYALAIGIGH